MAVNELTTAYRDAEYIEEEEGEEEGEEEEEGGI